MSAPADLAMISRHLEFVAALRSAATADLRLEIAWGFPDDGPNRARLFGLSEIAAAADFAVSINEQGCNVYVGITLKRADARSGRRTSNADAALATCIAIDIDRNLVAGARKLPIKPHMLILTGQTPDARGHLWMRIIPTTDLELWQEVSSRAVAATGGDMAARGRSRVMRLGGTVSYPSANKQQRGYEIEPVIVYSFDKPNYDLADLERLFPARPGSPKTVTQGRSHMPHRQPPSTIDIGQVASALATLPVSYADEHDLWVRTGFALHSFDSGARGLDLWKSFSSRCPGKASSTDFEQRWASFGRASGRTITVRWLFHEARRHGWRPLTATVSAYGARSNRGGGHVLR